MPLKFSKKAALEPFGFLNRENTTYALGHVACQSWVLIVTSLSQSEGKHSQEFFVISEVCVVLYCGPTSEHGEEASASSQMPLESECLDIRFQTKSDALPRGLKKKIPNFSYCLSTSGPA